MVTGKSSDFQKMERALKILIMIHAAHGKQTHFRLVGGDLINSILLPTQIQGLNISQTQALAGKMITIGFKSF